MNIVVTGRPGCGKTTVCERLAAELEGRGLRCGGVLCPKAKTGDRDMGKIAVDVLTKEKKMLAVLDDYAKGIKVGRYHISPQGVDFAKRVIRDAENCDIVFIDEIGPLELSGSGVMEAAKSALESAATVVVVVRNTLLDVFVERFMQQGFTVFEVTEDNRDRVVAKILGFIENAG
ncbi:MAG: DUF2478 domain-containing protein [Candidatus Altiarchaeota archaeon]|nr:DUF2478 domain-containing protein [Candidatus Altiarchaeota archaeon]